jgi:CheY-like chemotaxis protein
MTGEVGRPKVLIVEDSPIFRDLYVETLTDDYDLVVAVSKELAIAILREQIFAVALVDMRLQDSERDNHDGLEVAQFIRDMGVRTAIVLKSGFPMQTPDIAERIKQLGIHAVLDKSAGNQVRQLREAIAGAIASYGMIRS